MRCGGSHYDRMALGKHVSRVAPNGLNSPLHSRRRFNMVKKHDCRMNCKHQNEKQFHQEPTVEVKEDVTAVNKPLYTTR